MFLPRDRGESAVRLDSGGNSRKALKEVDGRKTSELDYLDGDGSRTSIRSSVVNLTINEKLLMKDKF